MKNRVFVLSLLAFWSAVAGAGSAEIARLRSRAERPTVKELEHAMDGLPEKNPFHYSAYSVYGNDQQQTFVRDLPRVIAELEKAYPGAVYGGLGRDSALMADALDAFYRAVGQPGRAVQVNLSGTSMTGATDDQIWRFFRGLPGVDLEHIEKTKGFVLFDGTRFNPTSQSRVILNTLYRKLAETGHQTADLVRKLNFVSTAHDGYRYYPKNDIRGTDLEAYFESQKAENGVAPEEILSVDAWSMTHGYEWSGSFQPFVEQPDGKIISPPGAPTGEREAVLAAMYEVIKLVRSPDFAERVNAAGRELGLDLRFVNIEQARRTKELADLRTRKDWSALDHVASTESRAFRDWQSSLNQDDALELLQHLRSSPAQSILLDRIEPTPAALEIFVAERNGVIETYFIKFPGHSEIANRFAKAGLLPRALSQLSDETLVRWLDQTPAWIHADEKAFLELNAEIARRSDTVQLRIFGAISQTASPERHEHILLTWLARNKLALERFHFEKFLVLAGKYDTHLDVILEILRDSQNRPNIPNYLHQDYFIGPMKTLWSHPTVLRWLAEHDRVSLDGFLKAAPIEHGLDDETTRLLAQPFAKEGWNELLASQRARLAQIPLPENMQNADFSREPVTSLRWLDLGRLEVRTPNSVRVVNFESLRLANDFMDVAAAVPRSSLLIYLAYEANTHEIGAAQVNIELPTGIRVPLSKLAERLYDSKLSDRLPFRGADPARQRGIEGILAQAGVKVPEKPKGKLFQCLRALGGK